MIKYIIALLPISLDLYIEEAQQKFGQFSQDYLLSAHSLPHITLACVDVDDTIKNRDLIEIVWQEAASQITTLPRVRFLGFNLSRKLKVFWNVSLTVARDTELVRLHNQVVAIFHKNNLKVTNEIGDLYRPHLTLARIKELTITSFNDKLLDSTECVLVVGQGDVNGQLLRVLYQ